MSADRSLIDDGYPKGRGVDSDTSTSSAAQSRGSRGSFEVVPLGYQPCKLGHRWACPSATKLPLPEQRCFCGKVAWKDSYAR